MKHTRNIKEFKNSEQGTILAIWGVSFAVIFGVVALSFDMGRINITQTELQSYADSVALAAAGELDGNADAITRSISAAENLITDNKSFGSGGDTLSGSTDYTLTFLSTLPSDDRTLISATTNDPREAVYARVVVVASEVDLTFGEVFQSMTGNAGPDTIARASAVAGYTMYACDITPLMFCLPPDSKYTAEGVMVNLRSGGNGAAWGPGNFGFLDPYNFKIDPAGPCAGLNGSKLDSCLIGAIGSITQCFSQRGVDTEPGQKVGIKDAIFNVRFDIYKSTMNKAAKDPAYAPAPNVIKGIVDKSGDACVGPNEVPSLDTVGLPRDTCFNSGGCDSEGGGRFGNGTWDRTEYLEKNYGVEVVADPHDEAKTRYEYYLAEIAAAGGADILTGRQESGRASCAIPSNDPSRRVVIAAGIDCANNPISGQTTGLPVKQFFKIFLTEPVGDDGTSPPNVDIWGEFIGPAGGDGSGNEDDGGVFRVVVQLYR